MSQQDNQQRLGRERQTIRAMIGIYCRGHHTAEDGAADGLCADCRELIDYAMKRLDRCPFGENKTTCARCTIHCYKPVMRQRIREVMRYAGPRMIAHHPILSVLHKIDGLTKRPQKAATAGRAPNQEPNHEPTN